VPDDTAGRCEVDWDVVAQLAVVTSVLILVWQTRALKLQIARGEMQSVYDRYLEITKIEVADPRLHKMFLYGRDYARFADLTDEELHERALSLLIFDQFALIFNMSKRPRLWSMLRYLSRRFRLIGNRRWIRGILDRRRTIWEINEEYVRLVLTNPHLIKSWRDWGLGETWEGSEFYMFVEDVISVWEAGRRAGLSGEAEGNAKVPAQRVASDPAGSGHEPTTTASSVELPSLAGASETEGEDE
jgi:hypothetical protein